MMDRISAKVFNRFFANDYEMGSTSDSTSVSRKLAAPGSTSLVAKPYTVQSNESSPARCVHFAKLRACQLQFSSKCCACADSRPKTDRASNGRNRCIGTPALGPFYQHYCKGCSNYFSEKEESRRQAKIANFRLWQKDPSRDGELSILYVNFLLRTGLQSVPFEVVHVILAFTYVNPPIAWFRSFDRPQLGTKILKQQTLNWKTKGKSAVERGHVCKHNHCQLAAAKAKPTSGRYSYYYTPLPLGCCACMDRRSPATRSIDVVYVDGKGDTVIEVPFYRHYCPGCRDHYSANPRDYPFIDA